MKLDLFDYLLSEFDTYSDDRKQRCLDLEQINIFFTLQQVQGSKFKDGQYQLIASTKLFIGNYDINNILQATESSLYSHFYQEINPVQIYEYSLFSKNDAERVTVKHNASETVEVFYGRLHIKDLIRNLQNLQQLTKVRSSDKTIAPSQVLSNKHGLIIFIVKGLQWAVLVSLLKHNGFIINGGSITKRHQLFQHEQNLSLFLHCLGIHYTHQNDYLYHFLEEVALRSSFDLHKLARLFYDFSLPDPYLNYSKKLEYLKLHRHYQYDVDYSDVNLQIREYVLFNIRLHSLILISYFEYKWETQILRHVENLSPDKRIEYIKEAFNTYKDNVKGELNNSLSKEKQNIISDAELSLYRYKIAEFEELQKIIYDLQGKNYKEVLYRAKNRYSNKYSIYNKYTRNGLTIDKKFGRSREMSTQSNNNESDSLVPSINNYLDDLSVFIEDNRNVMNRVDMQQYIESSWISLMKNKYIESGKDKYKFYQEIKYIEESLHLAVVRRKRFQGILNLINKISSLDNINYLRIALSIAMTYYDKYAYTAIAHLLGNTITYEVYKEQLNKAKLKYYRSHQLDKKTHPFVDVSNYFMYYDSFKEKYKLNNEQFIKLGDFYLTFFLSSGTDIFQKEFIKENGSYEKTVLKFNPEYKKDIEQSIVIIPTILPMVCIPNKWSDNEYGGFLENKNAHNKIYSGPHKHSMIELDSLYRTINYMSSIKFGINTLLLDYLLSNEGQYLLDKDISESEKLHQSITLKLAQVYKNISFYLNLHADWRGRIYTHSFFLSYQGSELASSLIQFWDGEPLNKDGLTYLYIYGANVYNEDDMSKKSLVQRLSWTEKHLEDILDMKPEFILKAENKLLFASFCLVVKKYHENKDSLVHIPIFLDATCSGIQHFAAMLRDFTLGSQVNLIPQQIEDDVADIYSTILIDINKAINYYGETNPTFAHFSKLKLTRKIVKTSIMTKVYNVTIKGITDQIKNELIPVEIDNHHIRYKVSNSENEILLSYKDIYHLAKIIHQRIFKLYPSLEIVYTYLLNISKLMMVLDIPLRWITPSGLHITQHYLKSKINKLSITLGGKHKTIVLREFSESGEKDSRKQVQAIIPNIIHSLDGAHISKLINLAINIKFDRIITVHDCFGTHPNYVNQLEFMVKKEFVLLYFGENFLEKFHKEILDSIQDNQFKVIKEVSKSGNTEYKVKIPKSIEDPVTAVTEYKYLTIPNVPEMGDLDLKSILNSKYMVN